MLEFSCGEKVLVSFSLTNTLPVVNNLTFAWKHLTSLTPGHQQHRRENRHRLPWSYQYAINLLEKGVNLISRPTLLLTLGLHLPLIHTFRNQWHQCFQWLLSLFHHGEENIPLLLFHLFLFLVFYLFVLLTQRSKTNSLQ